MQLLKKTTHPGINPDGLNINEFVEKSETFKLKIFIISEQ